MVVGLVIILGIGLVLAARSSRDPLVPPRTSDHWHAAYTFYECDEELPSFLGTADPDGIHSHQDGLIHIHPFNSSATGEDAQMSVFFEAMQVSVTDVAMEAPEFGRIEASAGCGDEPGVIKAARWDPDGDDGIELVEVYDDDFDSINFERDREAFTFALVAVGEDPPEPSEESLSQLDATTGGPRVSEGPVDFEDAVANTTSIAPGDEPATEEDAPGDEPATEEDAPGDEPAPEEDAPGDEPAPEEDAPATGEDAPATGEDAPGEDAPGTDGGAPSGGTDGE